MKFIDLPTKLQLKDLDKEALGLENDEPVKDSYISLNVNAIAFIPHLPNIDGNYNVFLISGEGIDTPMSREEIIKICMQDE